MTRRQYMQRVQHLLTFIFNNFTIYLLFYNSYFDEKINKPVERKPNKHIT